MFFSAPLNDKVLMNLATNMGPEYVEVGVALGLTINKVKQIMHDCEKAVPINLDILTTWRENFVGDDNAKFDALAKSFLEIYRKDLCDVVRNGE